MSTPLQGAEIKCTVNKIANDDSSILGLGTHIKVKIDLKIIQDIKIEIIYNHDDKEPEINRESIEIYCSEKLIKILTRNGRFDNQ